MPYNPFEIYADKKKKPLHRKPAIESIDVIVSQNENRGVSMNLPATGFSMRSYLLAFAFLALLLLFRIFYLQIITGDEYFARAEGNRIYTEVKRAARGVVYSADKQLLVKNVANFRLSIDGQQIRFADEQDIQAVKDLIKRNVDTSDSEVDDMLNTAIGSGQSKVVKEHIPYQEALQLIIETKKISGIVVDSYYSREYLQNESMSHILGYTAKLSENEYDELKEQGYLLNDEIGKLGIEKYYEKTLRGENGYKKNEVNYRGQSIGVISDTDPEMGNNIYLTIDTNLQNFIYEKLSSYVFDHDLPGAAAVAIDPRNGTVLALVSAPSFNNNDFASGISKDIYSELINNEKKPLFNRTISGEYPSGSTFKPVVAAAALEEGVVDQYTYFLSTGGIQIDQYFYPDWKAGGHGQTNVTKALAESVNTYFYLIGGGDNETNTGLGVDRITEYGQKFGLGSITGIDLYGEVDGFLPSRGWKEEFKDEAWYIGDTYHLAIGQGDILVTPLQVANYTAIIANGGNSYKPHLLDRVTNQQGELLFFAEPEIRTEQIVSDETLRIVREGLREAVVSGSARSLQSLGVSIAGKTGTAQFGAEDKTHSWFTCFAPYETPEIVLTILVEEGGEGNEAALPLSKEILDEYF